MRRLVWMAMGLVLAVVWPATAQQGQSSVQGRVIDASGAALPGVTVLITHEGSGVFRQVISNADGSFFATGLVPGPYRVEAELTGFRKYERLGLLLQVGSSISLEIKLEIGALAENVTVTGESPIIDVRSTQVATNIDQQELAALPILNRNWLAAVSLAPGIQLQSSTASFACESIIVGGGSNRSGNFSVDGGGNNDDYLGSSCGSQTRTALEAVQEFQVLTNQYDAEFGRTAGAVINAITKQGTNAFRGSLFGSYTGAKITAKDFFVDQNNLEKPDTSQTDWGGTLGGPVLRDRAHFFYSLDRLVYAEGRSNTFASRPELDYSNTQRMKLWNHMIRFDHQISGNNSWSARYLFEVSPTYDRISGRRTQVAKDQEYDVDRTAVATWNSVFGNTRFNTLRGAYTWEKNGFTAKEVQDGIPMTELPPSLTMLTFLDGFANGAQFRINGAYEVSDSFSWFVPQKLGGSHDIKFGGQYIYSTIELPDQTDMNGRFGFSSDLAFNASNPRSYPERMFIRVPAASATYIPTHVGVLFAQDKWAIGNATVNLGLRYDIEATPMPNDFNPYFTKGNYPVDGNNLSPRIGIAWRPGGSTRQLVRGGWGLFYDKITLITTTPFLNQGVYSDSFVAAFPTDRADPGPSSGQLPTNPFLVNGPVVNRAAINALFPPGSIGRNTGVVYLDDPNRSVPRTSQLTLGYERQLGAFMAGTVDYVHSWNQNQLITYNLNPGTRVNTSRTGAIVYTDLENIAGQLGISPFVNPVYERINDGSSQFDGVNFSLEKRYSAGWAARVSYAIGHARGSAEANQTYINQLQVGADPNLDLNFGPLDNDRKQNLAISGRYEIPRTGGLNVSGVYRWMSGIPITIQDTNFDPDRNGILFDPVAAGSYCGTGVNSICVENKGGRNGARGPGFQQMDMRMGYRFRKGQNQTFDVNFELYNLANTANFDNPTGDIRSTDFLRLTALRGGNGQPRAAQFSGRMGF
jgi:Carboxypeptidase regulatory-like domain